MVQTSTLIGNALAIVLLVAGIVIFFIRYRRKEFFLSAVLWGILSFFLMNVLGNMLLTVVSSTFFASAEAANEFLRSSNTALPATLLQAGIATVAFCVSAIIITNIHNRRGKVGSNTDEITGLTHGMFSWINPIQPIIFGLINNFMLAFAINSGQTVFEVSETLTQVEVDKYIQSIIDTSAMYYISYAVMLVGLALLYRAVYIFIGEAIRTEVASERIKFYGLAFGLFFITYVVLQISLTSLVPEIIGLIAVIVVIAGITYLTERLRTKTKEVRG